MPKNNYPRFEKFAILSDKAIAYLIAVCATPRDIRNDLMDPDAYVQFCLRYKTHFTEHVNAQNNHRLQNWFNRRNHRKSESTDYDPSAEIKAKGLQEFYDMFNNACATNSESIAIRYIFEKTEHQSKVPMCCTVGEYRIDFGGDGTEWCGGRGGNGYISKRDKEGHYQQIAVISRELSLYLQLGLVCGKLADVLEPKLRDNFWHNL